MSEQATLHAHVAVAVVGVITLLAEETVGHPVTTGRQHAVAATVIGQDIAVEHAEVALLAGTGKAIAAGGQAAVGHAVVGLVAVSIVAGLARQGVEITVSALGQRAIQVASRALTAVVASLPCRCVGQAIAAHGQSTVLVAGRALATVVALLVAHHHAVAADRGAASALAGPAGLGQAAGRAAVSVVGIAVVAGLQAGAAVDTAITAAACIYRYRVVKGRVQWRPCARLHRHEVHTVDRHLVLQPRAPVGRGIYDVVLQRVERRQFGHAVKIVQAQPGIDAVYAGPGAHAERAAIAGFNCKHVASSEFYRQPVLFLAAHRPRLDEIRRRRWQSHPGAAVRLSRVKTAQAIGVAAVVVGQVAVVADLVVL